MNNTNLNELLQILHAADAGNVAVKLTQEQRELLTHLRKGHAAEMTLWFNDVPELEKAPERTVYRHNHVQGDPVDIFQLLSEACLDNANMATLIQMVAKYLNEHVPTCQECGERHATEECMKMDEWNFTRNQYRLVPMSWIQMATLQEWLRLAEDSGSVAFTDDLLKVISQIRRMVGKTVVGMEHDELRRRIQESEPRKSEASTRLMFKVSHQFTLYLQRSGYKRDEMSPVQLDVMERCFYGAVSQVMILMKEELFRLDLDTAVATVNKILEEVTDYWDNYKAG